MLLFLVISGRFIYIQATGVVNDVSLTDWANDKRETSIPLRAERGNIYDQNGMILAYNRPAYRLYAILDSAHSKNQKEPKHVVDADETANKLAPILDMDVQEIKTIIENGMDEGRFQVEFGQAGNNLTQQEMEEIKALQIPGIYFADSAIRYYPNGMFASHIIGFAQPDEDNDELLGIAGMEREKNKLLSGTDGFIRYHRDKYDKKLLNSKEIVQKPENGNDIFLTIDQKIQTLLEDVLSQVDEQYDPERITAVVMNPKSGEILAMGNRPSYNPNNPDQVENWYNDVISTPFEPGSTTKMFTWAAAIDSGVYNGEELYKSGKYVVNEKIEPINDHNQGVGWGTISFDEGFRRSSNVAASRLVWEKMGTETYLEYLKKFDFDKKTEIDLPNEVEGQILYNWPSEKIRTSFGQGSTLTPIQQVKAATAIANNGKMVQPFVIKKIIDSDNEQIVYENEPKVVGEPISSETAEKMIELLDSVVNSKEGTGKPYRLSDYSVIGKTGTAQIPNPNGSGYLTGKNNNIFSFLGMAPKDDPQLLMHVSVKQPKLEPSESGSAPVSFIFNNVMENGLRYLNIEPDKDHEQSQVEALTFPDILNQDVETVEKQLKKMDVNVTTIGEGKKVVAANLDEGSLFYQNQRIIVLTDQPTMPDISGWSQRDVHSFATMLDMNVEGSGSGYVVKQSIKPGKKLEQGMKLTIELSNPL